MESVTHTFSHEKRPNGNLFSQLLIILSDGRGLTVSGKDRLLKSVRHAMAQNIFVVFIILDNLNHDKSTSIFQINEAIFVGDKVRKSARPRLFVSRIRFVGRISFVFGKFSFSVLLGDTKFGNVTACFDRCVATIFGIDDNKSTQSSVMFANQKIVLVSVVFPCCFSSFCY